MPFVNNIFICTFLTFILSVNSFLQANVICYTVIPTLNKSYLILSYLIYIILSSPNCTCYARYPPT